MIDGWTDRWGLRVGRALVEVKSYGVVEMGEGCRLYSACVDVGLEATGR